MNNQQFPSSLSQLQIVSLPGAWELIKETLRVYKSRFWVFIGIMVIPLFISLLFYGFVFILGSLESPWIWLIIEIIAVLALWIVNLWSRVSLLYYIKEREQKIGIKESFRKGWRKIIFYLWVSALVVFIKMGGFFLFIVPGIIFAIWFSLATYVLVSEDIKGMDSLFRSKQLVKGYWWNVFWRFLVMGCIVAVIMVPIAILAELYTYILLILLIGDALITPFIMTFSFLIYENLKELKREVVFEPPKIKTKIGFILIGIIGILSIPTILISVTLFL